MDGIVGLSFLERSRKDRRKHLQASAMFQLRIQSRPRRVGFILRDLVTVIVALLRSLLVQDILRMIASPRGEIGEF